jgi:transcriptional regulator
VYVPSHFAVDPDALRRLLSARAASDLITATADGLRATLLPLVFDESIGEHGALLGHVARNNDQWKLAPIGEAMAIVRGPDAYVSPSFYPSKLADGRVVPTWNYLTAHVYGELTVHDDPAWLDAFVRRLTDRQESTRAEPWSVDDAPPAYIAGQLRAIVGLQLQITHIEAKSKWSQNRSAADVAGVVAGLDEQGAVAAVEAMRADAAVQRRLSGEG